MAKRIFAFVAMLSLLGSFAPLATEAIRISPPIFANITLNPGETTSREIRIVNDTEEEITYFFGALDFVAGDETGNPDILVDKSQASPFGLASWVSFPSVSATLQPNEEYFVEVVITAPANAEPGGHYAAAFFSTLPPEETGQIGLGENTGALFLVTVPGDITKDMRLLEFGANGKWFNRLPVEFFTRVENRSNVHFKPRGTINIRGMAGGEIKVNPVGGYVLPSSIRRLDTTWVKDAEATAPGGFFQELKNEWKNFGLGYYKAELNYIYDNDEAPITATLGFWVIPWHILLVALAILIALIIMIILYNKMVIATARKKGKA